MYWCRAGWRLGESLVLQKLMLANSLSADLKDERVRAEYQRGYEILLAF